MNFAIIVAAGDGRRFGSETPKQFLELNGTPILVHALQQFENCLSVDEIVLVLSENKIVPFEQTIQKYQLRKLAKIVAGGATRAESVRNGLNAIDLKRAEIIAVHDGARPLVTTEEIERTIEKANETGAACLVAPVTDTIKEVSSSGEITKTIDRRVLRRALTPQCFGVDILRRAFEKVDFSSEDATDESFLVERLNIAVSIVEGSARNIKITVPEDLIWAENLLKLSEI